MPRTTKVPLWHSDDFEKLKELRQAVNIAERNAERAAVRPLLIGDEQPSDDAVTEARAAYDAFVEEAAERAEEWELVSISHDQFRDLIEKHPPRQVPVEGENETRDHDDDAEAGVNAKDFGKALLLFDETDEDGDRFRTVTSPDLPADELRRRVKSLSAGEYRDLWQAAYLLNSGGVNDPKGTRYSTRSSSETST